MKGNWNKNKPRDQLTYTYYEYMMNWTTIQLM